jgi:hypothetical protein
MVHTQLQRTHRKENCHFPYQEYHPIHQLVYDSKVSASEKLTTSEQYFDLSALLSFITTLVIRHNLKRHRLTILQVNKQKKEDHGRHC